ncbi:tyrosyl-DNA phosphodiesterase 1 [Schistosoma haematobium]|uniref:Tyrosyl-DNA phosphodiesterase 1 n=1 Tax=Schistosoma haematobium TaxID=6185 RepID=A0A922S3X2_SCHHA|nr:tyrosyl-DNA phosphodiesterase 1 [Schistosoma haematobium]KAH9592372.1 tyrosyl-DNA phosphodiesterase 1 [Schistosoma haematobium]
MGADGTLHFQKAPSGQQGPRVIMLQRSAPGSGPTVPNSPVQRPGLKTVKIITVPGQGAGGKPLKAAVIPMHMLQRTVKILPAGGQQVINSSGATVTSNFPRVLTIRPQLSSGPTVLTGATTITPVRPGTLIFSGAPSTQFTGSSVNYQSSEDVENQMIIGSGGEIINGAPHGVLTTSGYYDINMHNAAGFEHSASSAGREEGEEQEQVTTGLKTNGLRRYARCVCNKVKEKGITSYSEVADELVHEYAAEHPMIPSEQLHYIQKNIRRRVYDALNVLMALNVLQKEKKEIRWVGLPVNMIEECRRLEEEREKRQISLRNKTVEIQDLIMQLIAFKNLVMRNKINDRCRRNGMVSESNTCGGSRNIDTDSDKMTSNGTSKIRNEKIPLPFLVISTHRKTVIDCNISTDKLEYLFNFDQAYEIRDEVDTLKRMGLMLRLGTIHCTQEEYNQCLELVPPSLRFYVEAIYERRQAIVPDFEALHQQRRLFVEARLAAAAAAGHTDEGGDSMGSGGHGGPVNVHQQLDHSLRSSQRPPLDTNSHYTSLFDTANTSVNEGGLRQLYLNRSPDDEDGGHISGSVSNSGFVPGDTQHYARAAASRGYVVPGGPGGLLRHRQHTPSSGVSSILNRQFRSDGASRMVLIKFNPNQSFMYEVIVSIKKTSFSTKQSTNSDVGLYRPPCKYGRTCYRKNPQHFGEFYHPDHEVLVGHHTTNSNSTKDSEDVSTNENFYGIYLFRVSGVKYGRIPTITLKEILNSSDDELVSSIQFNYMFDIPWLREQYPERFRSLPLTIVHGFQGKMKKSLDESAGNYSNIRICQAHIRLPYGTHHTKMMMLKYKDGLKIIIHTANMISDDWDRRTQGIWISPKLKLLSTEQLKHLNDTDSRTNFRADLLEYLKSYGRDLTQSTSSPLFEWINCLHSYDFRPIKVVLIASVSGRHVGESLNKFGHTRLGEVLHTCNSQIPSSWPVIGQFSSIGSLGLKPTDWFTTEWSSSLAGRGARGLRMIYPCVEDVRNSLEGYFAGGCLPYTKRTAEKQPWLCQFFYRWHAFEHSRCSPHIKSYTRISPDGQQIGWFLLTSANLSKAAWGAYEKSKTQLVIRSYELGVLFLPTNYKESAHSFEVLKNNAKYSQSSTDGLLPFPIPYELPPLKYQSNDEPWIWDKPHSLPDIFGHIWEPS